MKKIEFFKIEGERINRIRKHCPKCGPAVFLAEHKNRFSCGKCGYTEFRGGVKKEPQPPKIEEKPEEQPVQEQQKPEMVPEHSIEEPKEEIPVTEPETPIENQQKDEHLEEKNITNEEQPGGDVPEEKTSEHEETVSENASTEEERGESSEKQEKPSGKPKPESES